MQSCYASISELISLSLTPEIATQFSDAAMLSQLQAASSEADTYLHSQFMLPLTAWDMKLKQVVSDIAAKRLFAQYGFNPNAPQNESVEKRHSEALKWLQAVASQTVRLEDLPSYADSSSGSPTAGPFVISNSGVGFATFNNGSNNDDGC